MKTLKLSKSFDDFVDARKTGFMCVKEYVTKKMYELLKEFIEDKYGIEITDEKWREAAHKRKKAHESQLEWDVLQGAVPPAYEVMSTLVQGLFAFGTEVKKTSYDVKKNSSYWLSIYRSY